MAPHPYPSSPLPSPTPGAEAGPGAAVLGRLNLSSRFSAPHSCSVPGGPSPGSSRKPALQTFGQTGVAGPLRSEPEVRAVLWSQGQKIWGCDLGLWG